ncbi:hypothetical protein FRC02_008636 [Tulasnella sp. 418]|nr:hypothetical protein FRC02_008636 [Tulasnella sp. 418]
MSPPWAASVIVGHQGTDPTEFLSLLNDADVFQDQLDQTYFTGLSSSYYVHGGFQDTFKRTASPVLTAVKKSITRINNDSDPIPIVPGRGLGFAHPDGEIHINDDLSWNACSGQDNTDESCSTGHVDNIFIGNIIDHLGSYNGVWIGSIYC